jgi:hypothetical protein
MDDDLVHEKRCQVRKSFLDKLKRGVRARIAFILRNWESVLSPLRTKNAHNCVIKGGSEIMYRVSDRKSNFGWGFSGRHDMNSRLASTGVGLDVKLAKLFCKKIFDRSLGLIDKDTGAFDL